MKERPQPGLFGPPAETPHYHGHRERLREKLIERGADALADYELLELVLFRAIPRGDVKPLAKRLIEVFGDFNHAISAPPERLKEVDGVGDAAARELKIVEAAAQRLARAQVMRREALSSWSALIDYCTVRMAHRGTEQVRALFLDRKNVLIADEEAGRGTVDAAPVYVREIVKRALALDASAVIVVHNHPSGDPAPSQADIAITRSLKDGLKTVGVTLHDHLVIGKGRHASFSQLGLL
jgi:DNA repair protein RadC